LRKQKGIDSLIYLFDLEYYRIKTEEIREQAAEQKRRIEEARRTGSVEVMDLSSLKTLLTENRDNYSHLQKEHSDLANLLRQLEEDFERISGEHHRAQLDRDRELAELRAQAEQREQAISAVLENNVSLRFEINTYRRLLEVEEGRIQVEVSSAPEVSTKKMTVQKSARG
jgi:chromosome segregation ATPase